MWNTLKKNAHADIRRAHFFSDYPISYSLLVIDYGLFIPSCS